MYLISYGTRPELIKLFPLINSLGLLKMTVETDDMRLQFLNDIEVTD